MIKIIMGYKKQIIYLLLLISFLFLLNSAGNKIFYKQKNNIGIEHKTNIPKEIDKIEEIISDSNISIEKKEELLKEIATTIRYYRIYTMIIFITFLVFIINLAILTYKQF